MSEVISPFDWRNRPSQMKPLVDHRNQYSVKAATRDNRKAVPIVLSEPAESKAKTAKIRTPSAMRGN